MSSTAAVPPTPFKKILAFHAAVAIVALTGLFLTACGEDPELACANGDEDPSYTVANDSVDDAGDPAEPMRPVAAEDFERVDLSEQP